MPRLRRGGLAVLLLMLVLAPAGSRDGSTGPIEPGNGPSEQSGAALGQAAGSGRITEGSLSEPRTLNPVLVADPVSEDVSHLVFNGLVTAAPDTAEPRPDLAASWDVSDDGLTYTFHLRDGVRWHDGEPFSARDVVFTYDLMMNDRAKSPRYSRLVERVRNVEAPDEATVTFTLARPDAAFLTTLATFGIVPEHLLATVLPEDLVANPFGTSTIVGTGPFVLRQWVRGDRIVFQQNAQYFKGVPAVQEYVYDVAATSDELAQGLRDGSIDWAQVDPGTAAVIAGADHLETLSLPSYELVYVALQLDPARDALLADVNLRRALMLALDRSQLVDVIWNGHARVVQGVIPPASWAATDSTVPLGPDQDEARRLLDAAGWVVGDDGIRVKDGARLRVTLTTNGDSPVRRRTAEWLVDRWREIGVEGVLDFERWSAVRGQVVRSGDFQALLLGYRADVDPDQSILWSSDAFFDGFNVGHYAHDAVDEALAAALATTDRDERRAHYVTMQDQVLRDLPVIPLVSPDVVVARNERLRGVNFTAGIVPGRETVGRRGS